LIAVRGHLGAFTNFNICVTVAEKDWFGWFRIINRKWDEQLRDESSDKYKTLKAETETMVRTCYSFDLLRKTVHISIP